MEKTSMLDNEEVYLGDGKHYFYVRPDRNGAPTRRVICAHKVPRWYGLQLGGQFDWSDEKVILNFKYEGQTRHKLIEYVEAKLLIGGFVD
jgi:hypothetical protein